MTYGTPEQPMTNGGSTRYLGGNGNTDGADARRADATTGHDPSQVSVGELMGDISRNLSTLMRQELDLAKAELRQEASKAGKAAGMLGGAGFAGYMTILFLSIALWAALERDGRGMGGPDRGRCGAAIGAVLFVVGRNKMRQVRPKPEQTVETLKETPAAIKNSTSRNA